MQLDNHVMVHIHLAYRIELIDVWHAGWAYLLFLPFTHFEWRVLSICPSVCHSAQLIKYAHNDPKTDFGTLGIPEVIFEARALKFDTVRPFSGLLNISNGFCWILLLGGSNLRVILGQKIGQNSNCCCAYVDCETVNGLFQWLCIDCFTVW